MSLALTCLRYTRIFTRCVQLQKGSPFPLLASLWEEWTGAFPWDPCGAPMLLAFLRLNLPNRVPVDCGWRGQRII